jgi:hypothetical protein
MKFIPLCFLLSLLVLINTKPLQGAELEPVVDDEGNPLEPGVGYYAWTLWGNNTGLGGLRLGETRNETCPLNLIRDPKSMGEPIFFSAPGLDFIPTLTDLTITIPVLDRCVQDSKILHTSKYETDFWFMSTRGVPGDFTTKFKIVKLQGDIYSFEFCPSHPVGVICTTVGSFVDSDGTKILALGFRMDEPYYFRFHKASSTFPLKMYQDLNSV